MPRSQRWHRSCRQCRCTGQMLQVLSGAGGGSQPLPAPKPWEVFAFQQQGGGDCFVSGGIASLGISPHKRPELQTIRHTTYLPEPPNVRGKPPGSGRCCRQERCWVPRCWVPPGGSCPSPPHRCHSPSLSGSPAVPEERQKRAHGHTWGTAPSPGGFTGQPQALHGAGGRTALRSCCTTTRRDRCSPLTPRPARLHRQPQAAAAGQHESPAKTTQCLEEASPLRAAG